MIADTIIPEQRLFVGVIVNAAQEAAGAGCVGYGRDAVQQSALDWFKGDSKDFHDVCQLAGLEPHYVRRRVLSYLERVKANPAALVRVNRTNVPARARKVSIPDVARRAGVSPTTVSNVIHDRAHITPSTRARVHNAIEQLGYSRHVH
ncbi:LacI family DNA-binding transcriptional regulator [Sphingomonas carotinifaciens]|uniref:LacI family DNA-binding transcriptional regulator n=1 Tax=Sphingomonas carotinifaciens TaxID=1166323 RepID=UPI0039A28AE5